MNPWKTPKNNKSGQLSNEDRAELEKAGKLKTPSLRIGYKEKLSAHVIAKTNAHLFTSQIVKVEFIKINEQEAAELAGQLAEKTSSELINIRGNEAVLFRKHPNQNIKAIKN
ncbi:MAG: YhbY family RNA-binding protein [Spirochaetes bacterium]|nr:YhbY family RNA-binding protein [Spirochaetota bacterium]